MRCYRGRVRGRGLGRLASDPLARSSALSAVATFVPQLVGLLTIPLIVGWLGDAAYGIWALVGTFIVVFMTLDGGISASAQRFYALYAATGRNDLAARLTVTLITVVLAFAGLVWVAGPLIATGVLAVADVPTAHHADSILLFRHVGVLVGLLLLANVFMGNLRARGHFGRVAIAVTLSQLAFVGMLLWYGSGLTLADMLVVAITQLGTLAAALFMGMSGHIATLRPQVTDRAQLREFFSYANRSLVTNVSSLAFLQAGPLFVAWFAPIAQVGQYSVAAMIASAIRSFPMFLITPLLNTLTEAFAAGGMASLTRLGSKLNKVWTPGCVGLVLISAAALWFVVRGFTGETTVTAPAAILLTIANGLNLTTGVSTACCRAGGRPGLEARYSMVLTLGIVLITGPAAFVAGAVGVAWANLLVQAAALVYFGRVISRGIPGLALGWGSVRWVSVFAAGALAGALSGATIVMAPHSYLTLAAAGGGVLAGCITYAVMDRESLTPLLHGSRGA